jgi:microcystin-dependent protein
MKRLFYSAALPVLVFCLSSRPAVAQINPYLGEIRTFAFNFCPSGWLPVQGQILLISQNEALFNLLGTTYGGDGMTTFALPKWGPIYTANGGAFRQCIAMQGIFPSQN